MSDRRPPRRRVATAVTCFAVSIAGAVAACGSAAAPIPSPSAGPEQPAPSTTTTLDGFEALVEDRRPTGVGAVFLGVFDADARATMAAGVDGDGRQVEPTDAWEAASISKMVVATAVLQLADRGLIDLGSPVGDYVDFPVADTITVRHVLGHRSGIPNMSDHLSACPSESMLETMKELADKTAGPTTEVDYSNTNYLLLGYLVGQVSGSNVGAFAKEHIFAPMGMASTYWWESHDGPRPYSRSTGSDPEAVNASNCPALDVTIGTEGQTFVSTLADLDAFLRGLFGGQLVSKGSLEAMLPSADDETGLGLWAMADAERGATLYGHLGSRDDFEAFAYYDPPRDRSIIVFGAGTTGVEDLVWKAWDWVEDQGAG